MSSIKNLLQEEKDAEALVKNAQSQAEQVVREARIKARELVKNAENDGARVKQLTELYEARISDQRARLQKECRTEADKIDTLCKKNFDDAVKLIVENVLFGAREK